MFDYGLIIVEHVLLWFDYGCIATLIKGFVTFLDFKYGWLCLTMVYYICLQLPCLSMSCLNWGWPCLTMVWTCLNMVDYCWICVHHGCIMTLIKGYVIFGKVKYGWLSFPMFDYGW